MAKKKRCPVCGSKKVRKDGRECKCGTCGKTWSGKTKRSSSRKERTRFSGWYELMKYDWESLRPYVVFILGMVAFALLSYRHHKSSSEWVWSMVILKRWWTPPITFKRLWAPYNGVKEIKMHQVSFWLNINSPTHLCTVHTPDCIYEPKESKFKGVRSLGEHGGWMPFSDLPSLVNYRIIYFPHYELHYCSFCKPSAHPERWCASARNL